MVDRTDRDGGRGGDHGLLHLILGCGLMFVALLALGFVDTGWGAALLLVAALICPFATLGRRGATADGRWWMPWRRERRETSR